LRVARLRQFLGKMKNRITFVFIVLLAVIASLLGWVWIKSRVEKDPGWRVEKEQEELTEKAPIKLQFSPPKSERPTVKIFLMSFCPYGNQTETDLKPVYDLLGNKVDWQPRYIVSRKKDAFDSFHGNQELNQNVRELCVFNLYDIRKWWDFVGEINKNCTYQNADSCWQAQAKVVGVVIYPVASCEETQGDIVLAGQVEEAAKYQASASPMIFVNDELYPDKASRTPEDYKKAICSAFEVEPEECATVLSVKI